MKRAFMIMFLIAFTGLGLFAQEVEPPTDVWQIFTNLQVFLGSIFGAFALVVFLAPLVIGALKINGKFLKYLFTAIVTSVVVLSCFFVDFGYLYDTPWWSIPINIVGIMLAQTGIFAIGFVKDILEAVEAKFRRE